MKQRIKNIMAEVFDVNKELISDDLKQNEFQQWDSLKHISLISVLENEFNITLEPEDISIMTDFEKIADIIGSKLNSI